MYSTLQGHLSSQYYPIEVAYCPSLHSDLGMLPEAEELLSDICRFYSEDQWLELSAPSYALLADCQKKLEMEDQYPAPVGHVSWLVMYPLRVGTGFFFRKRANCIREILEEATCVAIYEEGLFT